MRKVQALEDSARRAATELASDAWGKDSLSGEERNHLFLSQGGKVFEDLSGISGADHIGDGRSVVLLDYDRDGWVDIAGVNTNAPKAVLFRNLLGQQKGVEGRGFVAIRFVGGNGTSAPSREWSNRDGYGARVTVEAGGKTFIEEHRCGEGYSAQNSPVMRIGLGEVEAIDSLVVRWPSGREQRVEKLDVDRLVTVYENASESGDGSGFVVEEYRR